MSQIPEVRQFCVSSFYHPLFKYSTNSSLNLFTLNLQLFRLFALSCGFKDHFYGVACEVLFSVLQQFPRELRKCYASVSAHSRVEGFPGAENIGCRYRDFQDLVEFQLEPPPNQLGQLNPISPLQHRFEVNRLRQRRARSITEEVNATEIATQQKLDMGDAIQYSTALSTNAEAIISFDKHFNNLRIPRIEPQQTE